MKRSSLESQASAVAALFDLTVSQERDVYDALKAARKAGYAQCREEAARLVNVDLDLTGSEYARERCVAALQALEWKPEEDGPKSTK